MVMLASPRYACNVKVQCLLVVLTFDGLVFPFASVGTTCAALLYEVLLGITWLTGTLLPGCQMVDWHLVYLLCLLLSASSSESLFSFFCLLTFMNCGVA